MIDPFYIKRTNSEDNDFHQLVAILDKDLTGRYGEGQVFFSQFNKLSQAYHVVLLYMGNDAISCGAIKAYDEKTVEVKRMFTKKDMRGKGLAYCVLSELETWAKEMGYDQMILETGILQPEALHLYQKFGFELIPNYDQYIDVSDSVCMKKILTKS